MSEYILLLHKERRFVAKRGVVNTHVGRVDTSDAKIGERIHVNNEEFVVLEPTIIDLLEKCRRGAQIIMPRDSAQIIAVAGVDRGWRCLDGGSGSGFLSIFLGHIVGKEGRVYTYELRKEFYDKARKNIGICGMDEVVKIKNDDIANFVEENLDIVTLDMKGAEGMLEKAHERLNPGGWLVVYSPHVEQQINVRKVMEKLEFGYMKTIETIQREWKSLGGYTHPVPKGIMHTGFITFGRKI
jgi:tRNA (adenine57-N1/adenine58-N1)-methyltransferase catalytic subunit